MSTSTWIQRARSQGPATHRHHQDDSRNWIGRDLSQRNDPRNAKAFVPLLLVILLTALGIAALRMELIKTRYAIAAATERETALIEEQRALIARKRQLRDPMVLSIEARERGFRPPAHVYSLPDPITTRGTRPDVTAGPRGGRTR